MWVPTDFDYMIWEGKDAPNCPHCFKPLNKVLRKGVTIIEYYPPLNRLMFEHSDGYGYYCSECGIPFDNYYNTNLNDVMCFWIDKHMADELGVEYK